MHTVKLESYKKIYMHSLLNPLGHLIFIKKESFLIILIIYLYKSTEKREVNLRNL
jgi:hypothetical protein